MSYKISNLPLFLACFQEMKEEVTRTLTTINPQAPTNLVEYSYEKGAFVPIELSSSTVVLIHLESSVNLKDPPDEESLVGTGDWGGQSFVYIYILPFKNIKDTADQQTQRTQRT